MLYHVSFNEVENNLFYPRMPQKRAPYEDKIIKRICFSPSIEKCIEAMPDGGKALQNLYLTSRDFHIPPILHVYSLDETCIPAVNLVPSTEVTRYVQDAEYSQETWVVNQEVVCEHEIIKVTKTDIRLGLDRYGSAMYSVECLEWEILDTLPPNAPEIIFNKAKQKLSFNDVSLNVRDLFAAWH